MTLSNISGRSVLAATNLPRQGNYKGQLPGQTGKRWQALYQTMEMFSQSQVALASRYFPQVFGDFRKDFPGLEPADFKAGYSQAQEKSVFLNGLLRPGLEALPWEKEISLGLLNLRFSDKTYPLLLRLMLEAADEVGWRDQFDDPARPTNIFSHMVASLPSIISGKRLTAGLPAVETEARNGFYYLLMLTQKLCAFDALTYRLAEETKACFESDGRWPAWLLNCFAEVVRQPATDGWLTRTILERSLSLLESIERPNKKIRALLAGQIKAQDWADDPWLGAFRDFCLDWLKGQPARREELAMILDFLPRTEKGLIRWGRLTAEDLPPDTVRFSAYQVEMQGGNSYWIKYLGSLGEPRLHPSSFVAGRLLSNEPMDENFTEALCGRKPVYGLAIHYSWQYPFWLIPIKDDRGRIEAALLVERAKYYFSDQIDLRGQR